MPWMATGRRPLRRIAGACAALLCVALGAGGGTAAAAEAPANFRPFAPDSIWNLPLRDDVPLHPDSAMWVAKLASTIGTAGVWINSKTCGMPSYWAAPGTATTRVTLAPGVYQDKALLRAWAAVPIPPEAKPANCSDKNFAVLQQQPDGTIKQWEFWSATKNGDGTWVAKWGGVINDVQHDRGIASPNAWRDPSAPTWLEGRSTYGWNVTARSVSMTAGVISRQDLARGVIDHALSIAIPDALNARWLWPAQRTDGGLKVADAIP